MSRRLLLLFAALLMLPLLGFDAPREYDDATAQSIELEGVWQFVSVEYSGQTFPNSTRLIFQKGQWEWTESNPKLAGHYKVDTSRPTVWVDMTTTSFPSGNPTMKAIYRIDGDILKMANGPRAIDRPLGYDTKDSPGVAVWTLKRVK